MNAIKVAIHAAVERDLDRLVAHHRHSIRAGDGWEHKTIYEFADGETVELAAKYNSSVVFPAQPGFEWLTLVRSAEGPDNLDLQSLVATEPVIAWHLFTEDGETVVEPIMTSGYETSFVAGNFHAIRLPDRTLQWKGPFDQATCQAIGGEFGLSYREPIIFETVAAWIAFVRRVWSAQLDLERKDRARHHCPSCGQRKLTEDSELPF